jgi:hypothetical protein
LLRLTFGLAMALALSACSDDSTPTPTSASPTATSLGATNTAADAGCAVKATGAATGTIRADDNAGTSRSDHWLSDAERADADVLGPLVITCTDQLGTVTVAATDASTLTDVPLSPANYAISDGAERGHFTAAVVLQNRVYQAATGQIALTRFDYTGAAGSFVVDANGPLGSVHLAGAFSLSCQGISLCQNR